MSVTPASADDKDHHERIDGHRVAKVAHVDGTVDYIDTHAMGGNLEDMPPGYYKSVEFIGTVAAVCMGSICAYLGWVLPANTLALINEDLGSSPDINWVATCWTLGTCIGFLLIGRLSDIFGRKWMVMGTTGLSLVGCILGSTAQSVRQLIAANLLNGLAASGQLSFGITLGELVPNKHRGLLVTLVFLSSLPFAVFGPVIARTFIDRTASGWRWSFFLGDILGVLTLVLFHFFYHPPTYTQLHVAGKTKRQALRELDFVGIFLFVAGCVLFLVGLSSGGTTHPWTSAPTLCTLLLGLATLAAFAVWEAVFCTVPPLMPPRLFRNTGFVGIVVVASIAAMVYYSLTVLWPTLINTLYTTDSLQVGWESSVIGGGVLLGQLLGGVAIGYVPRVKAQTVVCGALAMAFITALAALGPDTHSMVLALGTLGLVAIGYIDNITFPGITLVQASQDIGLATGVMGSIRALCGAVAQAMYVNVLNNKLAVNTPKYVTPAATAAGLPPDALAALFTGIAAGNLTAVPGMTPAVAAAVATSLKTAYQQSFKVVFYCTIPFSAILLAAAFLVPDMEPYLSLDVAKKLKRKDDASSIASDKASDRQIETVGPPVPLQSVVVEGVAG